MSPSGIRAERRSSSACPPRTRTSNRRAVVQSPSFLTMAECAWMSTALSVAWSLAMVSSVVIGFFFLSWPPSGGISSSSYIQTSLSLSSELGASRLDA